MYEEITIYIDDAGEPVRVSTTQYYGVEQVAIQRRRGRISLCALTRLLEDSGQDTFKINLENISHAKA